MAAEDYEGPPRHEKKFHKTHFTAPGVRLRKTRPDKYEWVQIRFGRYVRRKVEHAKEKETR